MEHDVKADIGVKDDARKKIVETLNMRLCDEYVLYTKTRKYHWNVIGPRFHQLHEFFKEQYEALDEMVDEIAERARHLGGKSLGTLDEFVRYSSINEDPGRNPDAQTMISNLLKDHETIIKTLRKNADEAEELEDMATNDFSSLSSIFDDRLPSQITWLLFMRTNSSLSQRFSAVSSELQC
jgi:starvation-inducible DNA-binding protein